MITLAVKGNVFNEFACCLGDTRQAQDLLDMLSSIHSSDTYYPAVIEVKTDKNIGGKEYMVGDNSFCINVKTKKEANLVQETNDYYHPDKKETGAKFMVVCDPYIEKVNVFGCERFHIFINVVSNKTNEVYRVVYREGCVIE